VALKYKVRFLSTWQLRSAPLGVGRDSDATVFWNTNEDEVEGMNEEEFDLSAEW